MEGKTSWKDESAGRVGRCVSNQDDFLHRKLVPGASTLEYEVSKETLGYMCLKQ
jgi:hypothetical protein